MRLITPLSPIQGVALGQKPTAQLTIGPTYYALTIEVIATPTAGHTLTLADVLDRIRLTIDGRAQRDHFATELDAINTSYGSRYASEAYNFIGGVYSYTGGVIDGPKASAAAHDAVPAVYAQTVFRSTLFLAEPWRDSYAARMAFAWATMWPDGTKYPSLQLEMGIPQVGASNVDTTQPFLINVYADYTNDLGNMDSTGKTPVQLINRFRRTEMQYSAAGDFYMDGLDMIDLYSQVSFFNPDTTDIFDNMKVLLNSQLLRDVTAKRNAQSLIENGFNSTAVLNNPDKFHMVFDHSDLPTDGLVVRGAKSFSLIGHLASAAAASKSIKIVSQVYGPPD